MSKEETQIDTDTMVKNLEKQLFHTWFTSPRTLILKKLDAIKSGENTLKGIINYTNKNKLSEENNKRLHDYSNMTKANYLEISKHIIDKNYARVICLLLTQKQITKEDGEYFYNAVMFLSNDEECYKYIISENIVTPDDKELYWEIINKWSDDSQKSNYLIPHIVNRFNNKTLFDKIYRNFLEQIKNSTYSMKIYLDKFNISKEDKELFELTILSAINVEMNAFNILKEKIVTSEDGGLFTQTVNAVKKPQLRANLVKCGIIPEE